MYAFTMHENIFECFLMPLSNLDSTTGCSHEIQNFFKFLIIPDRKKVFLFQFLVSKNCKVYL